MTIQLLSQDVAAKIAAGEVVERPANVAKELIENSLDAGATEVQVEVREGGQRLLRVRDDGEGISAAEIALALQRHGTSKLQNAAQLAAISSFGFRGEALYSIAAVSRMTLSSRRADAESGAELRVEGGNLIHNRPAGLPAGTVVSVENIFFNTPARRKFLRRPSTEASHIAAIVQRYALAYPACRFQYVNEGKLSFSTEGSGRVADVLAKIYGRENAQQMIGFGRLRDGETVHKRPSGQTKNDSRSDATPAQPQRQDEEIDFMADQTDGSPSSSLSGGGQSRPTGRPTAAAQSGVDVSGFVSQPSLTRPNRTQIDIFVNRRYVEDRSLTHAVVQAYHTLLPVGRFPLAVVFVVVDPAQVDVNVHPRKTEVRFVDSNRIFSAVQRAVRSAVIGSAGVPELYMGGEGVRLPAGQGQQLPDSSDRSGWAARRQSILNAGVDRQPAIAPGGALDMPTDDPPAVDPLSRIRPEAQAEPARPATATVDSDEAPPDADQNLPPLRVVGQVGTVYVVAEGPEGLYLIDQHAAHERILYEKFMAQRAAGDGPGVARQGLLEPISLHVGDVRAGAVARNLPRLNAVGFDVEHFGGDTFLVRAVPSLLSNQDSERVLDEIVAGLAENRDLVGEELEARLVKMVCKRASIKAGQILSDIEMKELVRQLEQCGSPRTCPHGRPTMVQLSAGQLDRAFKRT